MNSKQVIRKQVGQTLRALEREQLKVQGERCAQALRGLAEYKQSKSIAFYMHMESGELPTTQMITNAFDDKKRVFLPSIVRYNAGETHEWYSSQRTHLRMLEMPTLASVQQLQPRGKFKLKEPVDGFNCLDPSSSGERLGLDLIVMPGVAFTGQGGRLGHGAGYYDSFIAEHETDVGYAPKLIGVGLQEQLLDSLPMEAHDKLLDFVIINGSIFDCQADTENKLNQKLK